MLVGSGANIASFVGSAIQDLQIVHQTPTNTRPKHASFAKAYRSSRAGGVCRDARSISVESTADEAE